MQVSMSHFILRFWVPVVGAAQRWWLLCVCGWIAAVCVACQPCPACPVCPPCPACPATASPTEEAPDTEKDAAAGAATSTAPTDEQWFVTRVVDGDTLGARLALPGQPLRNEYIRLLSIDTPEKGEPLFSEATEALKYLVRAGDIRLEFRKPGVESRDGFGRLLADIFAGDVHVNVEMVRQGYTTYWTRYGKSRFEEAFQRAEAEAKQQGLGIHASAPDKPAPQPQNTSK